MKFSFRKIALIISGIMLGVFIYQLYWLSGLYRTTARQFEKNVYEAMDVADQNEVFIRMDEIESSGLEKPGIAIGVHAEKDSTGQNIYYAQTPEGKDTLNTSSDADAGFNLFEENVKTTEKLAAYIKKSLHLGTDAIKGVNINLYDSLLNAELQKVNITQPYLVEVVKMANDSVLYSTERETPFPVQHAKKFDFLYDFNGVHAYRLYIKNPNRQVVSQMAGMLSTSVIIFGLLIFVFMYLLKTIRRMQTEEELKTNFTNNMTHELKTPIAVSYAAIDALLVSEQPPNKERQKKYLSIAKEQMEQLTGLVEQILSMSRRDNKRIDLEPEHINLAEMVSNLEERTKLFLDKKVNFVTDLGVKTITADKMHFFNILSNLIENSIKYGGDKVNIKIVSRAGNKNILVQVEDNGPGIEPRYQSRIFDKFYRIPTGNRYNVKGYGLGLFYVKEMIERHGGTVFLESHPGKGSTFTLKIPKP